jgi:hypothetical protein
VYEFAPAPPVFSLQKIPHAVETLAVEHMLRVSEGYASSSERLLRISRSRLAARMNQLKIVGCGLTLPD